MEAGMFRGSMNRRKFLRSASAGLVAAGLLDGCAQWKWNSSALPVARGTVSSGGKPLAGVRVSDGYHVVTTDYQGRFEIPLQPESGHFIFVVTPPEYWIDRFWAPIHEALHGPIRFRLKPITQEKQGPGDPDRRFEFFFLTDIHLGEGGDRERSFQRFSRSLEEIRSQSRGPHFLWFGGDISIQRGWGVQFQKMVHQLGVPVRHCIGSDDLLLFRPDPREEYHFYFGPTYYSFDWGRFHFIALDGCRVVTGVDGGRRVHAEFSAREMTWLEEDLRLVPAGTPTVIAVHFPVLSTHPARRGMKPEATPFWVFQNSGAILSILERYYVVLVLQGHLHENERLTHGSVEFVETVSVCGRWWESAGREVGVSGEPRGYRRVTALGSHIFHEYVSSAESRVEGIGEVVGNPQVLPRADSVPILVNIYDGTGDTELDATVDDGTWNRLQPVEPEGNLEGLRMAHHWLWNLDTRPLRSGSHRLRFRLRVPRREADPRFLEHRVRIV